MPSGSSSYLVTVLSAVCQQSQQIGMSSPSQLICEIMGWRVFFFSGGLHLLGSLNRNENPPSPHHGYFPLFLGDRNREVGSRFAPMFSIGALMTDSL